LLLQVSQWNFLTIPAPILTIIGSALAIILAFKNQLWIPTRSGRSSEVMPDAVLE
jgi:hypothetical protein